MTQLDQSLVMLLGGTLNTTAVEYYAQNYYVGSYLNQLVRYILTYGKVTVEISGLMQLNFTETAVTLTIRSTQKQSKRFKRSHLP